MENGVGVEKKELNIQEIREYNKELKEYTRKFSDVRAKMELNTNEVNRLCRELTEELGIEVTPQNLETVYTECVNKINNQLAAGKEILERIKREEMEVYSAPSATEQATMAPVTGAESFAVPNIGDIPQMFNLQNQAQGQTMPFGTPFGANI